MTVMIFSAGRAAISSAVQAQRAAGQHRIDMAAVAGDGLCPFGRRRCEDQVKALMLENRQIIIDGFNQYQNGGGHARLL